MIGSAEWILYRTGGFSTASPGAAWTLARGVAQPVGQKSETPSDEANGVSKRSPMKWTPPDLTAS